MNLTIYNHSQMQFLTQDYVTYQNCLEYTQGLRDDYKGLAIFTIILLIFSIYLLYKNKRLNK